MIKKFYLKFLMGLLLMATAVPLAHAETAEVGGSTTQTQVPLNCMYGDYGYHSQMVYSQTILENAGLQEGAKITAITFYANGNISPSSGSVSNPLTIKLGQSNSTSLSSFITDGLTTVSTTGDIWSGNTSVTLEFDNEYIYNGGNLLIDVSWARDPSGKYGTVNWFASSATGASRYANNNSSGVEQSSTSGNYLPKITFTYEPGESKPYDAKVTPASIDFGTLLIDGNVTKYVTIQNKGTQDLPYSITGLNAPFSISNTSGTIAAGADALNIPVTFAPTAKGSYEGDMVISFPGTELADVTVHVAGSAADVICDGEDANEYLPIYGWYYDGAVQRNQMIYPASLLTKYVGKNITAIKFFTNNNGIKYSGGSYKVSLGTTTTSAFESSDLLNDQLTTVKAGLSATDGVNGTELTITFDEPFLYEGNNLLIDVELETKGTAARTYFLGANQSDYTSLTTYAYSANSSVNKELKQFLPKIEITAEDGAGSVTVNPSSLTFGGEEFYAGSTEDKTFTVSNTTEEAVTITMTGDNVFTFNPATVAAGATETITVTYSPTAAGTHTATLTVGGKTVSLTGTAAEAPVITPTITTSVNAVSITTAPSTTGTATFTVTGANLEGDITLVASEGFSVNPATIAAADAANGVTVTVAYPAPATLETKTGTITLTSDGAEAKTVTITAESKDVVYEASVTPASLNFGEVLVGQTSGALEIKVSNTGSETFTPAFSINNEMFTIDEPTAITGETSINYNVRFAPTATGVQTGVLTVTIGTQTFTVSLAGTGTELADYDIASSAASGVHNFGDVFTGHVATWNFTLTNNGANAVTPVIEGLAAPFTAENVPATLAAGESATITIKFAPTEIQAYGPTSIVVGFAETTDFQFDYTLRGKGIEDTGTLPPSAYDAITYTWTDADGNEHPNTPLTEIATDPDQMIALMREVYTNKNLPGNLTRGYNADGTATQGEVAYPAIGGIVRNYTSGVGYSHDFEDAYGWGIAHDEVNYPTTVTTPTTSGSYEITRHYLDQTEYRPNDEGLTLLLVEMKDGTTHQTITTRPTSYASLRNVFDKMFKSVRVIPNSKRVTRDGVEGTLFKIDCDKMNRFFFLAKGRLRHYAGQTGYFAYFEDKVRTSGTSGSTYTWYDSENTTATLNPFNVMFEQFSPVSLSSSEASSDVYQELINMESYAVEHDCEAVPWASSGVSGHEFNMYGKESISDDCQDVRDLMFFVPDKRMQSWSNRDKGQADMYVNYYQPNAPTMGMYVIRQNEITGERNGEAEEYTLHLSWESNLTDFVPGENGEYTIYLVNPDGTYTVVAQHISSDQTTYDFTVDMAQHGQQVTYVIQGQDNTGFLSLQFSNEESFIIPGLDPNEKFQMMTGAEYYSRFDPQSVQNFYANGMQVMAYPDAATSDYAGQTFNFYRKAAGDADWRLVGTAQVNTAGTEATVSMVETTQRAQSEYKFGYKQNPTTVAVTTDANSNKVFGVIFDNFKADVSTNEHPSSYSYKMEVANTSLHSNEISIKVYKTQMRNLTGTFTEEYVENDEVRQDVDNSRQFDIDVEHSSKTEILRYGAYRWNSSYGTSSNPFAILNLNSTEEEDISPQGQASNQGEFYSVYMNGDSYIGDDVYVAQGETGQATFVDDVPATTNAAEEYTYVPVIETFTGRADYNTYGAPMQTTATGKILVNVVNAGKSEYTWEADGNTYRYYNVFVNVNTLDLPEGYEVAKIRAWRKIDASYLNEKLEAYAYRADLDANGEFMFDDPANVPDNDKLGSEPLEGSSAQNEMYRGTFGALDVENGATVPMKFFVRIYFKKSNGSKAANDEYYITEVEVDGELNNSIPTSIFGVENYKVVTGIKYYNLAGIESDVPFQGVNIEVTTYDDGSRTTRKIMK